MDSIAVDAESAPGFLPEGHTRNGFSRIPMWVADMNFPTAPSVTEAIVERAKHPAYGYYAPRDEYYEAIRWWHRTRNNMEDITKESIGYENGVLGGVISALRVFCAQGGKVLVHSPTYIGFTECLTNNGFNVTHSPLKRDAEGVWRMDFENMERSLKERKIHAAIFCSPHNPCGRVWEEWEIRKAMGLFRKYDVYVVSDEIWSDLTLGGHKHIPTRSVSEDAENRTVTLYAPSKTFNLAGLIGSYHVINNPYIRDRVLKQSSLSHYNEMNVLSMYALIGAYSETGSLWVDALRETLDANVDYAYKFITSRFEGVELARPEGTYMLFLDCSKWLAARGKTLDELERSGIEAGVIWQDGRPFFGEQAIRMNLALPFSLVKEAFDRLDQYVFNA